MKALATSPALRRGICGLGIAMARRDDEGIEARLRELADRLPEGTAPPEAIAIEEAILQTLLFLGFPAALTTLALWRRITDTLGEREGREEAPERAAGEAVCQAVYGRAYPLLRERMKALHPAANHWMVEDGYGKVMGRPGLDLVTRELLNVVLLAATDFPEQLHSHLRGALLVGATTEEVEAAFEAATVGLPPDRREALAARWREVASRANEEG